MNDPAQKNIVNLINKAAELKSKSKAASKSGNIELCNKLAQQARELTTKAEQEMKA